MNTIPLPIFPLFMLEGLRVTRYERENERSVFIASLLSMIKLLIIALPPYTCQVAEFAEKTTFLSPNIFGAYLDHIVDLDL